MQAHTRRAAVIALVMITGVLVAIHGWTQGATKPADKGPKFQPVVVVELAVSDLDRSVEFYTKTLGMKLEYRIEPLRWAKIYTAVPGLTLGLGESKEAKGSGSSSVNLAVADTDKIRKLLESRGVKFTGKTTEIPSIVRLADFVDPDGNRFRLAGPPSQGK